MEKTGTRLLKFFSRSCVSILFFLFRLLFRWDSKKMVLLYNFPEISSLLFLNHIEQLKKKYDMITVTNWKKLSSLRHLATASVVCLNSSMSIIPYLWFHRGTKIVQFWHGDGALKRWGMSVSGTPSRFSRETNRYDAVICSNETVKPFWAEAFGVPLKKVYPIGSPRLDYLTEPFDFIKERREFDRLFPHCCGKKLILYAPTFRESVKKSPFLKENFIQNDETFILLQRMHPSKGKFMGLPNAVDVSEIPDVLRLLRLCDCLITDYSSLMLHAAAVNIRVLLFVPDLEEYSSRDRGFYVPLERIPPGKICKTRSELISAFQEEDREAKLRARFVEHHLGHLDGCAGERFVDLLNKL